MRSRRDFLFATLGLGAALTVPRWSQAATPADEARWRAGAGRAAVAFPASLYPFDGFTTEHDPLAVRVLLLDDGDTRVGIAVVDLTSISDGMVAAMKAVLTALAGVPAEHAIICAGHSFATPHVFVGGAPPPGTDAVRNEAMRAAFDAAMRAATAQAVAGLQPARYGFGDGTSRVGVNRDVPTPRGWWLGANDAGYADPSVGVIRVDGHDGRPLAVLVNAAVQPSVMDGSQLAGGGKAMSADLAGAVARRVEAHYAGAVALFVVGAAGDQSPYLQANRHVVNADGGVGRIDLHETGFALLELLGERLGTEVIRVADRIRADSDGELGVVRERIAANGLDFSPRRAPVGPVTSFAYQPGAGVEIPVVLIRLGDIAFVGMSPELAASVGAAIRAASPYPHTVVATMVDGAAKYLPDAQSYDRFTYEARSSPYARGTAEAVAEAIGAGLERMRHGQPRERGKQRTTAKARNPE